MNMKRVRCCILIILMTMMTILYSNAETALPKKGDIAWLMKLYGFNIPDNVISTMHTGFSPRSYDCGEIQVNLQEILYDGIWLYTSASVTPANPSKALIVPSSADINDFVAGGYRENLRDDSRSFLEAATEDKKVLLYVNVYPEEFDQIEYYFTDHRQDAGFQSTGFSGAPVGWMDDTVTINLLVQVDRINLLTGEATRINLYKFPVVVNRIGLIYSETYDAIQDNCPIASLNMIQTPLSVYAFPKWKRGVAVNSYRYTLLDNEDNPIAPGSPPDANTFILSELPEMLNILMSLRNETKPKVENYFFERTKQ